MEWVIGIKSDVLRLFAMIVTAILILAGYLTMLPQPLEILDDETQEAVDDEIDLAPAPRLPRGTRAGTSWPMYRCDLPNSGFTTSSVPNNNSILWSNTTGIGDAYGSPAVEDGKVFIGSADGYLYCFDLDTGNRLWRTLLNSGDFGICGSPAVANNHVVVFSSGDDTVYRLRVSDGGINWSYPTGWGHYGGSSPAINNGRIYIGSGTPEPNSNFFCLNETTGNLIWSYTTGAGSVRDYYVQSSPAVANGRVFVGACDCYLYCFNESQPSAPAAQYYWRTNLFDAVFASPAVANGRVYCGSGYYSYGEGTDSHTMFCLDELTGAVIWSYPTGSDILSSPAIAYGNVYFTSTDGELYCVDAMSAGPTPTLYWSNTTGDTWSSPAVSDGKVVVGSRGTDTVYCFNATTGTLIWSYDTGGFNIDSSPAIADGKVVISYSGNPGSNPESVYCFGSPIVYTIDRIEIETLANGAGSEIPDQEVDVGTTIPGYAAAHNDTFGYLYDVQVNWSVANGSGANASTNPTSSVDSSDFYSGFYGGTANWTADDGNGHTDQVQFTIRDPDVGYITIVDTENSGTSEIDEFQTVDVGFTTKGYAAAFNYTTGYLYDIQVNWYVVNSSGPNASTNPTSSVNSSNFYSGFYGGTATWTADDGNDHTDHVQFTIIDPAVDNITIVDTENSGTFAIVGQTVDVGYSIQGYAAGFNDTIGYIGDIPVTWSVINTSGAEGETAPISGTNSILNVGLRGGAVEWIADYGNGHNDTVMFTVRQPTIDYIIIRTGDNGTGSWVGDSTYVYGSSDTFYAAGYNYTADWVEDVPASWSTDAPSIGNVSPGPSNSTTFDAINNGTCNITATYNTTSNSTGVITIINYTVDYIIIRDAPGNAGSSVGDNIFGVGELANFYAAAYNYSAPGPDGYLGDVAVEWNSSNVSIATVTTPGISTLFSAQFVGGECNVTARYDPFISNMTGKLTVLSAKLDYILITDAPNGTEITIINLDVGESKWIYASGYNNSGPTYMGLIDVEWSQSPSIIGSFGSSPSSSTTFTAGTSGGTTTITAENTTLVVSDNFTLTVDEPTIDYIQIRDASGGSGSIVGTGMYVVSEVDEFYAAACNHTVGYLYDVEVTWWSDNTSVGQVTSPGSWTNFTAQVVDGQGTCTVTATYNAMIGSSTGLLTVFNLTIDYIQIRDAPGNAGNIVTIDTYMVYEIDEFYAAAYNNFVDYLYDVEVTWWSNASAVGQVTSPGNWTNFTAQWVDVNSTCFVTAQYSDQIFNVTGVLTVLPPTIDFIQIWDEDNNIIDAITLDIEDWIHCYAVGYNETAGYLGNIVVTWTLVDDIATLIPVQDYYTNLTATIIGSSTLFASYNPVISNSTQVTIRARISAPTGLVVTALPIGNALNISWDPNTEENLAGYNIYRCLSLEGEYLRMNTELIASEYYVDGSLTNRVRYYYFVVAIDTSEKSSDPSEKASGIPDIDTDEDGLLNYEDDDDDNDGLADIEEAEKGTNPLLEDTDGDGYNDKEDYYPLDSARWEEPVAFPMFLLLIPIIVITVVLILLFALFKRRKPEKVPPMPFVAKKDLPPPPRKRELPPQPGTLTEDEIPPPEDEIPSEEEPPPPGDEEPPPPEDEIPSEEEPPPPGDEEPPLPEEEISLEEQPPPPEKKLPPPPED